MTDTRYPCTFYVGGDMSYFTRQKEEDLCLPLVLDNTDG